VPPETDISIEPLVFPTHKGFVIMLVTVVAISTVTVNVVGFAHCPALGVKE
jgi:hypothetical protein